ncbi:MAG: TlpA family protein disulfide reductase [Roseiflexaceae bacterium]
MRHMVLLFGLLLLAGCGMTTHTTSLPGNLPLFVAANATLNDTSARATVNQPAPDFTWHYADGRVARLSDLAGQRVVLNFWATWCEPCRKEMPDLDALDGHNDTRVIGINKGQQIDVIPAFAQELGVDFMLVSDPDGDVSLAYGARNLPTSVFIDRNGTINAIHVGILSADALALQLERMP